MKKNIFNIITLFFVFLLCACANAPTSAELQPSPPLPTLAFISTMSDGFTPTYPPYQSPTPTNTSTPTSTPDYAALGIPSPTPTPTFEYDKLSSFYLTPFTPWPTLTGQPTLLPTPNIEELLSKAIVRKVMPQSHLLSYFNLSDYIQLATDLMNYFDGNKEEYLQYINSLSPVTLKFSSDWYFENDFDNDSQSEWLISLPIHLDENGDVSCGNVMPYFCPRYFFLFEKQGDSYYPVVVSSMAVGMGEKVVNIQDLNQNDFLDIVFQADICGSACSTYINIAEWDGTKWSKFGISSELAKVIFEDLDGNGTIEISLKYSTGAASKYNSPYPFRENMIDVYGWKNNRYELIDQIYPTTGSIFATIFDIAHALEYKNAELAFKRINPVMESLDQSCDRMKTYVGIQAMFAYAIQGDANSMKSTLVKLEKYCDFPRNAYVPAAKILWLAYEESRDPISACQAMQRFLWKEYSRESGRFEETLFIDWRTTNVPSCPRE